MNDVDHPLGGVGTSCTTSKTYMMFGLGLGQKKKILIGKADRKKLVSGLRFDQNFQILPKKMRQDKNFLIFSGGQIGMIPNPFCGWMESHFGPWVILSLYWVYGWISISL